MHSLERQMAELQYEIGMLRTALEFLHDPADRNRILRRASACITEYAQLIDARRSAHISVDEPVTAQWVEAHKQQPPPE